MQKSNRRDLLQKASTTLACSAFLKAMAHDATGAEVTKPRIKIGQIGVGHAHANKLSVYRESKDFEVVGIVEPDLDLRRAAESNPVYQGLPWMTQEQLLNISGLQAVLVETHVKDLLDIAEACIDAGKHIHLDKPAGDSLSQFHRILDVAARKQLVVQMGYMYRYNPAVLLLKEALRQGWLGEIFEVHTVMSKVVAAVDRRELSAFPGGIMFELGGHVIELVVGILGKPAKIVAYPRHSSPIDDSLMDNMLAVFEYPNAMATVKSTAIEIEGGLRRHLVVCGSEGTFHIQPLDNPSARIALSKDRGQYKKGYQDIAFPKFTRYVHDAADMASILRGEKASDFSYEHDLSVQTSLLQASGMSIAT